MFRLRFGRPAIPTDTNINTGTNTGTDTGTDSNTTTDKSDQPIIVIDGRDNSSDIDLFLDILNNPCNYRGKVVYLTHIGPTARPDPFLWADKFYFNEGCEWFESPFALGALL